MTQFVSVIRSCMALLHSQAFYLLINNSGLPSMLLTMAQVYKDHRDEDCFLYMTSASQEMFAHRPPAAPHFWPPSAVNTKCCVNILMFVARVAFERWILIIDPIKDLSQKKILKKRTSNKFLWRPCATVAFSQTSKNEPYFFMQHLNVSGFLQKLDIYCCTLWLVDLCESEWLVSAQSRKLE